MGKKFHLVFFSIITLIISGLLLLNTGPNEVKNNNKDQIEIEKAPIILKAFGGTIEIPRSFIISIGDEYDFVNYFRDVDGTKDSGASIDMFALSLNKSKDYQVVVPSNKIFEKIENEYQKNFLIEKWTPKEGQSFNRILYLVIISKDNDFIVITSKNSSLWKEVLDSYKADI